MKLYKKGDDSSYTLGVFPTIELLEHKPDIVKRVVVHSSIEENRGYPKIKELCALHHIPIDVHDATINKLSQSLIVMQSGYLKHSMNLYRREIILY